MFSRLFSGKALVVLAVSLPFLLTGCKQQQKNPATQSAGNAKTADTVKASPDIVIPKNIAVLDLASLDTLMALNVEASGVPAFAYPPSLAVFSSDRYKKVGSLYEPDYDALNALSPDLVIVGGRTSSKYADLAKRVSTIDMYTDARHFQASVISNVRTLAARFGKTEEAEAKIRELEQSIEKLKLKTAGKGKGLVILTTAGGISAYGPRSRFGIIHDEYGLPAAVPNISDTNHGQPVSLEFIRHVDPDWLFVVDRDAALGNGGMPARQILDSDLIRKTRAWKYNRIVYLDPVNWYLIGGGLGAMQKNVNDLLDIFDSRRQEVRMKNQADS